MLIDSLLVFLWYLVQVHSNNHLAVRAKDEDSSAKGLTLSTNVMGIPVWGWGAIGASIGIVLAWSICYCYWRQSSSTKNNVANSKAMMMANGGPPPPQPNFGF